MLSRVDLGLGSNLGNRLDNLILGMQSINKFARRLMVSSIYETTPVGFDLQPRYLNAVCTCWVSCDQFELLNRLQMIEFELERRRVFVNGPRTLDIDILLFGDLIIKSPILQIPHPRMGQRGFVLTPLTDVAPNRVHPLNNLPINQMLKDLCPKNIVVVHCDARTVRSLLKS